MINTFVGSAALVDTGGDPLRCIRSLELFVAVGLRYQAGMNDEILNAVETAAFLRVNRKTIYEYAARHRIPHQKLGRRIVFSKAALLQWLNANANGPRF